MFHSDPECIGFPGGKKEKRKRKEGISVEGAVEQEGSEFCVREIVG